MSLSIREKPPLRLSHKIITPSGRTFRWAADEPNPANVPADVDLSSTMPGGHENAGATLARKANTDYSDLTRFSTWRIEGAGGECAWEGRLEEAPRVSGDQMAVTPQAVGGQAYLDDDKSAAEIYVDQDLGSWNGPSVARQVALMGASVMPLTPDVAADEATGEPSLTGTIEQPWVVTALPGNEAWYDGGGVPIGDLYYAWKKSANLNSADANFSWQAFVLDDDAASSFDNTANLRAAGPSTGTLSATTATRTQAMVRLTYGAAVAGGEGIQYKIHWTRLAVYGDHGLTLRGTNSATEAKGVYASDVIAHALGRWAPSVTFTEGSTGTIVPTTFVIPQLAFKDRTTVAEIIRGANRFHIRDWAVWEGQRPNQPTFYYHDRGARGRSWRARVAPAKLEETGASASNLWNGVLVRYQDVDGSTRLAGPPGSGCQVEDTNLEDTDPTHPANLKGIRRWDILDMGGVSTSAGAIEVGRRFLIEARLLNTSGRAQLVGHVEDDKGVLHPAWKVRAGDTISFVDAHDRSERRVAKASYSHPDRTCSVDLDAPPEGIAALLERLMVVLVPLGI